MLLYPIIHTSDFSESNALIVEATYRRIAINEQAFSQGKPGIISFHLDVPFSRFTYHNFRIST